MLKNVCIIGAGNIGSRHLQAVKKVKQHLLIQVIDPSADSLRLAKQRYEEIKTGHPIHKIELHQNFNHINPLIDIAIVSTNSAVRSEVTKKLLSKSKVKYIIFEKLLFQNPKDFKDMKQLLDKSGSSAWVNCNMRTNPFHAKLKQIFNMGSITYLVSGSGYRLVTNSIHFIDHIAYLTDCFDFTVNTDYLSPTPIESKRKGFLELNGSLIVNFRDGSTGIFTCYPEGNTLYTIQISSEKARVIVLETDKKAFLSINLNGQWSSKKITFLYQSQMTDKIITSLLNFGSCPLPTFELSSKIHLTLLNSLFNFLNAHSKTKYKIYPFT